MNRSMAANKLQMSGTARGDTLQSVDAKSDRSWNTQSTSATGRKMVPPNSTNSSSGGGAEMDRQLDRRIQLIEEFSAALDPTSRTVFHKDYDADAFVSMQIEKVW